ncbi:MAG: SLBB domain-containing protein [Deltaproteobacteria bacterium]|nr:MAG: SLBB domain-containing protein [Deltaproteobacteria bacterium]
MRLRFALLALMSTGLLPGVALSQEMTATVRGEVGRPGTYAFVPGERLTSLIEKSGGFTDNAWTGGAVLTRKSALPEQSRELEGILAKIEEALRADGGISALEKEFLAALATLSPAGRVPVRLSHPRLMKGTADDVELEEGDDLFLPPETGTVDVAGAVKNPGSFPIGENRGYEEVLRAAGGFTEGADRKHVYLLTAGGAGVWLSDPWIRWNPADSRWELSAFRRDRPAIGPGDTIVVPKRPTAPAGKERARTIPGLLMEIARITGAVVDPP